MRILRKRIVLVIIFALSLTYCILSFLHEVRNCAHNDPSRNHHNLRKFILLQFLAYIVFARRAVVACIENELEVMFCSCFTFTRTVIQYPKSATYINS